MVVASENTFLYYNEARKAKWRRQCQPTSVLSPGESHGPMDGGAW